MAATDPVEQIDVRGFETDLAGGRELSERLAALAAAPPAVETPYLTVTLDWRPDGGGPGRRPARRAFDDEVDRLLARHAAHSPARQSLEADVSRVRAYLDGEAPAAAQGLAIVACHARGLFEAFPLGQPLPTWLAEWPTPALAALVRAIEDYPRFVIVQIEQREALVSIVDQTRPAARVEVSGDDYPRHQAQGGWSQRRYQARADERIEAFARAVAELTRKVVETGAVENVILMGDEVNIPPLRESLHQTIAAKVIGTLPNAMNASERELLDLALPRVEAAERARELGAARAVQEAVGANGPGAAGPEAVLTALQSGQVQVLVLNDDLAGPAWADYTLPLFGAGSPPGEHPAGGDTANLVGISLPDELVRLALQSSAEIEIVRTAVPVSANEQADIPEGRGDAPVPRSEAARLLDEYGGVGAVLRFALAEDQPTADL
jgi:peptide subunit release factor 1 (eRF1)